MRKNRAGSQSPDTQALSCGGLDQRRRVSAETRGIAESALKPTNRVVVTRHMAGFPSAVGPALPNSKSKLSPSPGGTFTCFS